VTYNIVDIDIASGIMCGVWVCFMQYTMAGMLAVFTDYMLGGQYNGWNKTD